MDDWLVLALVFTISAAIFLCYCFGVFVGSFVCTMFIHVERESFLLEWGRTANECRPSSISLELGFRARTGNREDRSCDIFSFLYAPAFW